MDQYQQKVLVIEDNPVFLKLIQRSLVEEDCQVAIARNGLEALEVLESFRPDIIFIDWIMEKISGAQFCRIVRNKPHFQNCYLVILSGMAAEAQDELLAIKADAYIAKGPFQETAGHIKALLWEQREGKGRDLSQVILGLDTISQSQASVELLKRTRHHELVLQNVYDAVVVLAEGDTPASQGQLSIVFVNKAACLLLGASEGQLLTTSLSHYFGTEDRVRLEGILAEAKKGQPVRIGDASPLRLHDRYVWLSLIPFSDGGEFYITGVLHDVTKQKKAELDLQRSKQQLQLALEGADLGMWDWDIPADQIYFGPRVFTMLGYEPREQHYTMAAWEALLHPEDLPAVRQQLADCLSREPSEWSLEFRMQTSDGAYRWVHDRGQVVSYNVHGLPLRAAGTYRDITAKKEAEAALQQASMEWATAMDASEDAIYLLDLERRVLRANRKFCQMIGKRQAEITGRHISEVVHPQGEKELCPVCRAQEDVRDAEIVMEVGHPDNPTELPLQVTVKVVKDQQGRPISILMTLHDLSAQRQGEETLRRSQEEWEKTFDAMSDIVTIQDRNMRVVKANRSASEMLNEAPDELLGKYCYYLFSGQDTPCADCPELATLKTARRHSSIIRHEKLAKTFLVSCSPLLDDNGEVEHLVHVAKDITEQKRLEEQQAMYSSLIQQSNDSIYVIDPESAQVVFVNRHGLESHGYQEHERGNLTIYDVSAHLDSPEDWQQAVKRIAGNKTGVSFESRHLHKSGSTFPVEINARILSYEGRDFIVAIARDISDRKRAEKAVYEEKSKLEAVVNSLDTGLTMQDRNFVVLYQNENHQQKHGCHVGKRCYQAYHGRDTICPGCLLEKCFVDGKSHHRETTRETEAGTQYLDVIASPFFDENGVILGGVETVQDITSRKMMEMQIQHAQKMEAIGTLAGGIAHDFNNILAAIMGYSEMALLDTPEDNPVHVMLTHVTKGAERARDLVKQILTFSRKGKQQKASILLQPIVKEVLKLLRATIPTTIAITSDMSSECGSVVADPTMVHQLVMNLCTNSYHAMQEQGGELFITLAPVTIDTATAAAMLDIKEGPYVQLAIRDTGHGMDENVMKQIFDPYFTTKGKGEGTGLGLAVVHGIVHDLGGAIRVDSQVGKGTTFEVLLPLHSGQAESEELLSEKVPTGKGRILLVDDEPAVTAMASAMLSRLGYQVAALNSSRQALEAFVAAPQQFDLVITDQTMPEYTGLELLYKIKEVRQDMPVLLMSGYSSQVNADTSRSMGLAGYLAKPFKDVEIGSAVHAILARK